MFIDLEWLKITSIELVGDILIGLDVRLNFLHLRQVYLVTAFDIDMG